jgi:tetratricopeptide (TPR) repeat protein
MAYVHRGDVLSALPHIERAVKLAEPFVAPAHQELKRSFHVELATVYQVADMTERAESVLRRAIGLWEDAPELRLRLAQLLATSCRVDQAVPLWEQAGEYLDGEQETAALALAGATRAYQDTEHNASMFLRAHAESYRQYFDDVTAEQAKNGWLAEASRMARAVDSGELVPGVSDGARPWALSRVDIVNPSNGEVASIYSETEPMIVALNGLEPLAQVPILFPWPDQPFGLWVCSQCPWHWLSVLVQFRAPADSQEALFERIDERIGQWYLDGYNGTWGDKDSGRFHYSTDPEQVGDRAVQYIFDLGRARYEAMEVLVNRLVILHDTHPIERVLIGGGRLPPDA